MFLKSFLSKVIVSAAIITLTQTGFVQAQQNSEAGWSFSADTTGIYGPKSDHIAGDETHFAPITGGFESGGFQESIHATYTIPIPFNDGMCAGNTLSFDAALSLTPLSLAPEFSVTLVPLPFLSFNSGVKFMTSWELMDMSLISKYDASRREWKPFDAFDTWSYTFWASGTLMFDTAIFWPGEWHHILMMATAQYNYSGLAGTDNDCEFYSTMSGPGSGARAGYSTSFMLGYQIPRSALKLVGVQVGTSGYFNDNDLDSKYKDYDLDFATVSISPMMQFELGKKDSLMFITAFSSRRNFAQEYDKDLEPLLTCTSGREWFFSNIICNWHHTF